MRQKFCLLQFPLEQDRTALLFLLFPLALLILRSWVWDGCLPTFPVQAYQVCANHLLSMSYKDRADTAYMLDFIINLTMILCLLGMALISLHWSVIARKHTESKRK